MKPISYRMREVLKQIANAGGSKRVNSGFPTFTALEKRGLAKLNFERREGYNYRGWYIDLTDAGWQASGVERKAA